MHHLVTGLVLLVTAANALMTVEMPPELLGENVFAHTAMWHNQELHLTTVENMRFGHGQGENLTHWRRRDGETEWHKQALFPEHNPGMTVMLPLAEGAVLFLYVDRRDERERAVYLTRVEAGQQHRLFEFRGGSGVLNPQMDLVNSETLHLLLPDRTDTLVRRFLVNIETGDSERLPDVEMPRGGARIYERLVHGNRLVVPVSVVNEMLMLVIDLEDHSYTTHSVDRFESVAGEPPRMTSIFHLPDLGQYALVYMRPAPFSDRPGRQGPATGLLGELVCNVVDAETLESVRATVIAGFEAEAAATHNIEAVQTGPREFLLAHTEVDRIHQRHLDGQYVNYVGGFLTLWRIAPDGLPEQRAKVEVPPFFCTRLTAVSDDGAVLVANEAVPGDPLHLHRITLHQAAGEG